MTQEKPMIVVNFKTYKNGTGENGLELAKKMNNLRNEKTELIAAVQNCDIHRIAKEVVIPVYAQHIDPIEFGSNTGHDLPEAIKKSGAFGALINHSEDSLKDFKRIEETFARAEEAKLKSIVCVPTPNLAEKVARFKPEYIAFEPPELIGGDVSVTTKPDVIKEVIKKVNDVDENITVLIGAGVKSGEDVKKALELGAKGVLVASGVVKSKNPMKVLQDFIKACE